MDPFLAHLVPDIAGSVVPVTSPWIFGYSDVVRRSYMLAGLVQALGLSRPAPGLSELSLGRAETAQECRRGTCNRDSILARRA
jgi:hypothetical protein